MITPEELDKIEARAREAARHGGACFCRQCESRTDIPRLVAALREAWEAIEVWRRAWPAELCPKCGQGPECADGGPFESDERLAIVRCTWCGLILP